MGTQYKVLTAGDHELSDGIKVLARRCCIREHRKQRHRPYWLAGVLWLIFALAAYGCLHDYSRSIVISPSDALFYLGVVFWGLISAVVTYFLVNGPRIFFSREPHLVEGIVTDVMKSKAENMVSLTIEHRWRGPFSPWAFTEFSGEGSSGYWMTKVSMVPKVGDRVLLISEGHNTATVIGYQGYVVNFKDS